MAQFHDQSYWILKEYHPSIVRIFYILILIPEYPPRPAFARFCYTGADQHGATYWIAIPADNALEDLQRLAVTVRQGYAWAGSSYRRPGYGVRMAAEDTDNLRKLFIDRFGKPALTLLHGQSWGGNVAARGLELADTEYAVLFDALTAWIRTGIKPAPRDMPVLCAQQRFGGDRHFMPEYLPAPLFSRVAPRN